LHSRVNGAKKQKIGRQSQVFLFSFGVMKEEIIHSYENAEANSRLENGRGPGRIMLTTRLVHTSAKGVFAMDRLHVDARLPLPIHRG
jgi:hypothetical protein